jgi:hypothetical protein
MKMDPAQQQIQRANEQARQNHARFIRDVDRDLQRQATQRQIDDLNRRSMQRYQSSTGSRPGLLAWLVNLIVIAGIIAVAFLVLTGQVAI